MIKIVKLLCAALALQMSASANAALINFTGNITYHNDVIYTYFSLDQDATNVRVWTDSFRDGTNFDPITALWNANGSLIEEDDDNDNINPSTQTRFDSGFTIDFLAAGDYLFTVATYNNRANGRQLSDGFNFDSQAPILLRDWTQPANSINMGSFWSVWLDGVSRASNPTAVPEPGVLALMLLGVASIAFRRKAK
ncbi:PEP-CTERM sorting domain-containing protein [Aestuariibacter sp. AA17]|uniref:PEP-CTERM sorting domain-containing protein n=1 Tax=Fluctibacter corallii TaxID=2984329 RepID=A0ABT3A4Q5_9ALTE|nr:PEP-CTERM sorting domain-containing protein [Aestuariibacter sp. AA17]MCV2883665.1 PEP-CTERM sorting domain-containing protein [Aestuariibacter sp. AA17]